MVGTGIRREYPLSPFRTPLFSELGRWEWMASEDSIPALWGSDALPGKCAVILASVQSAQVAVSNKLLSSAVCLEKCWLGGHVVFTPLFIFRIFRSFL